MMRYRTEDPAMNDSGREFKHVDWSKDANIYEVNIRQYTPEGTFSAFEKHLPRLKKMGVKLLWLMPIQPSGKLNRKGSLGSSYSVSDYVSVNPELGTLEDFKRLVRMTHEMGMYIIVDWVANHTAWDHSWVKEHPDWYKKNEKGEIHAYIYDNGKELEYWTDVVGLDYEQPQVWTAMIDALKFWVRETDIDGYRCDVAGLVPTPFWEQARVALDSVKPVFMLAEWSEPELHEKAFDMTYDWDLHDAMAKIAKGKGDVSDLMVYLEQPKKKFPKDAYRMLFTTNHDKNAWEASDAELYGESFKAFAVLAATLPGMPLIYGGQESFLDKRLAFFEKDPINWKNYELADFYTELLQLKKDNSALWNGASGGGMEVLPISSEFIFAYRRSNGENAVTVIVNLSDQAQEIREGHGAFDGRIDAWSYTITRQ